MGEIKKKDVNNGKLDSVYVDKVNRFTTDDGITFRVLEDDDGIIEDNNPNKDYH